MANKPIPSLPVMTPNLINAGPGVGPAIAYTASANKQATNPAVRIVGILQSSAGEEVHYQVLNQDGTISAVRQSHLQVK